ncbi:hypothetical protein [Stappia sp.]|uniref:hypothetical protein n=1 Tax=Stappia sp. TaxID=1870903 RepID=UPI0032D9191A
MAADKLRQVFSPRDEALFPLQVLAVRVTPGEQVAPGAVLLTLKTATGKTLAMRSPLAGAIAQIAAGAGDTLARPRVLVTIAEDDADVVDGEWEDAPEPSHISDAGDDGAARAGDATAAPSAGRRSWRTPVLAAIAVLLALGVAYPLVGEDLRQALRSSPPPSRTSTPEVTGSRAASSPAAATPARYSGRLSEAAMRARDIGDAVLGWRDAPRFVGLGVLRIERGERTPITCEAVAISDRFAAISTLCYEPAIAEYGDQEDMRVSFEMLRPVVSGNRQGNGDEVPGFWRLRRLNVKALHVWPGRVGDEGTASIALAEFADPAPGTLGASGFWRFTEKSAPPVVTFRGIAPDAPARLHAKGLTCRYWLAQGADAPGSGPLSLDGDPACGADVGPRRGPIRVRHANGRMYFAGFFTAQRRTGKILRRAVAFSRADTQLMRLAKDGAALPHNRMTVRPLRRLDDGASGLGLRFTNPCDRKIAFHILGSNTMSGRQNLKEYTLPAGHVTPVEHHLEPAYFHVGVGQAGRGPIRGSKRDTFKDRTLHLVPFRNKSGMELQIVAACG